MDIYSVYETARGFISNEKNFGYLLATSLIVGLAIGVGLAGRTPKGRETVESRTERAPRAFKLFRD